MDPNRNLLVKRLFTEINRLKKCNTATPRIPFLLEKSIFPEGTDDDEALANFNAQKDHVIVGRIQPNAEIFNEGSYQIEMKITPRFPAEPPEVRFLTLIYHPNVGKDGQVCTELLKNTSKWTLSTYLVDVVKALVEHIDKPNIDYATSLELGRQYQENRELFDQHARDYVKKYSLPPF